MSCAACGHKVPLTWPQPFFSRMKIFCLQQVWSSRTEVYAAIWSTGQGRTHTTLKCSSEPQAEEQCSKNGNTTANHVGTSKEGTFFHLFMPKLGFELRKFGNTTANHVGTSKEGTFFHLFMPKLGFELRTFQDMGQPDCSSDWATLLDIRNMMRCGKHSGNMHHKDNNISITFG